MHSVVERYIYTWVCDSISNEPNINFCLNLYVHSFFCVIRNGWFYCTKLRNNVRYLDIQKLGSTYLFEIKKQILKKIHYFHILPVLYFKRRLCYDFWGANENCTNGKNK